MPILTAGLDKVAFLANADGTWTVICDTKIVENCAAPLSNTLHVLDGTVIERGMLRLRNSDLIDILQARAPSQNDQT
jgi:hypothetical protein